jgi:DNA-directed RNA polymerase specialized sigma24 family protein
VLASYEATPADRNDAAARVLSNVRAWAGPYLKRVAPCGLDEDDVAEAVQHLLDQCCAGSARFRGTTEGEARVWCMRVLTHKGIDLCRGKRRLLRKESDAREKPDDPDLESLARRDLTRVFEAMMNELPRLHRSQDVEGLTRSLWCHIEARMGATLEEQLEKYGTADAEVRAAQSITRARNRVYTYRARGRLAGCEALSALVAQGRFLVEEIAGMRRLLGCDLNLPGPRSKVHAS